QLIDARSDQHLWAQTYDRTLAHSLTLESEVANQVATQLAVELRARGSGTPSPTYKPEAYDLYLKALGERNAMLAASVNVSDPDPVNGIGRLQAGFTRAIELDAQLAPAYAERVPGYLRELALVNGDDAVRRAREDLETAERLAPTDPKVI